MDKILKRNLYEEAGVKEYWIVDIQNELVEVYFLEQDQQYGKPIYYANNDQLESFLFEKLKIEVSDLFS
jgi:Uma2 family endonuclease